MLLHYMPNKKQKNVSVQSKFCCCSRQFFPPIFPNFLQGNVKSKQKSDNNNLCLFEIYAPFISFVQWLQLYSCSNEYVYFIYIYIVFFIHF